MTKANTKIGTLMTLDKDELCDLFAITICLDRIILRLFINQTFVIGLLNEDPVAFCIKSLLLGTCTGSQSHLTSKILTVNQSLMKKLAIKKFILNDNTTLITSLVLGLCDGLILLSKLPAL